MAKLVNVPVALTVPLTPTLELEAPPPVELIV